MSLSQLWKLSPLEDAIALRLRGGEKVWQLCEKARISAAHLVRSNKSMTKLRLDKHNAHLADPKKTVSLSMHMATTLFTMALVGSVLSVANQAHGVLEWSRELFGFLLPKLAQNYTFAFHALQMKVRKGPAPSTASLGSSPCRGHP